MMITIFTNYQLALFVAQLNVAFEIHFQFGLESLSYFFCYCFFFILACFVYKTSYIMACLSTFRLNKHSKSEYGMIVALILVLGIFDIVTQFMESFVVL